MRLILRWVINACALLLATQLISGFTVSGVYAALVAVVVLGLLNAVIRPLLILLTLPVNILTLGLFTFVINAALIWLTSTFVKGIAVSGFLPALAVAVILWAVSTVTSWLLRQD
jgi:putative membrane protein